MDQPTLLFLFLLTVHLSASGVVSTIFTVVNECNYTVWPASVYKRGSGSPSLATTGFVLKTGESSPPIYAPNNWSGRFWARTRCAQDTASGNLSCATGDCGTGDVACDGNGGMPPVTLAEFTLSGAGGLDFFDISAVDGYNLPIAVVPHGGSGDCSISSCSADVNAWCPPELQVRSEDDDKGVVACKSACLAFNTAQYCCSGAYGSADTCKPTNYSLIFKRACPQAYSYAYDDATSTFTCASANYTITFCPSTNNTGQTVERSTANSSKKKWKWIIPVIIVALFIVCGCILWLVTKRGKLMLEAEKKGTKVKHTIQHLENSRGNDDANENQETIKHRHALRLFSYDSIMEATDDFASANKLGEGGFGPVYKGKLMQKEVAIKRLSKSSRQGVLEFKTELRLVSELQHMNLVQLLGYCIHKDERLLIYEYMPNKSLDFFLFDSTRSKLLDWKKRLNIIEGIAQGLLYLHKYSRLRIVHRDLKASNILLDEYINPKISDFGMAKICMEESEENTKKVVGTLGYIPPEYAMGGFFSRKSDVYSFGVLLLEIVSGRRNNSFSNASNPMNLVGHIWELWKEGKALELVDPTMHDSVVQDQVLRCIHIGLLCVEELADDRPTMSEILSLLANSIETLPSLKKPAFYFGGKVNAANESHKHKTDSINGMSISDFTVR